MVKKEKNHDSSKQREFNIFFGGFIIVLFVILVAWQAGYADGRQSLQGKLVLGEGDKIVNVTHVIVPQSAFFSNEVWVYFDNSDHFDEFPRVYANSFHVGEFCIINQRNRWDDPTLIGCGLKGIPTEEI